MGLSQTFAEGELTRVRGLAGAGFYRLAFDFKFVVRPVANQSPRITAVVADIAGPRGQMLGRGLPEPNQLPITAYKHVHDAQLTLSLDLDHRRMEAIEDLRNGGDLPLNLSIYSRLEDASGEVSQQQSHESLTVNQGVWVKVLGELGYARRLLLEVDVPDAAEQPGLANAVAHLQKAQKTLMQGEYRDAIGACRDVLEEVAKTLGDEKIDLHSVDQRDLDKAERLLKLRQALKLVAHPARHRDEVSAAIDWTRRDAISIVAMTTAVVMGLGAPGARPSPRKGGP